MSGADPNHTSDSNASDRELAAAARIARLKKELAQSKQELRRTLEHLREQTQSGRPQPDRGSESGRAISSPGESLRSEPLRSEPSQPGLVASLFQLISRNTSVLNDNVETDAASLNLVEEPCPTALFDAEFYLAQASAHGLIGAEANPWASYVLVGESLGLNPHPLFKTQYYLQQLAWQTPGTQTWLAHYLAIGHSQGLRPHPLFAPRFYQAQLEQNDFKQEEPALLHYLSIGYRKGLKPSPLFDPAFYLEHYADVQKAGVEPLCHYIRCGDKEGRRPNAHFDSVFYRQHCGLLTDYETGLEHYLEYGRFEGKKPNQSFGEDFYLDNNIDAVDFDGGAFAHFCQIGAAEGRLWMPSGIASANPYDDEAFTVKHPAPMPQAPCALEWEQLEATLFGQAGHGDVSEAGSMESSPQAGSGDQAAVTVIIPVYRNLQLTLACIYSVLRARCKVAYRLLVVDDHSPEPSLSSELDRLAGLRFFTLLRNEENLGFVGTVNRGMSHFASGDVVLLNSDTVVFDGWLDRLVRAAYSDEKIATATPFSNNADLCSYPLFCADNNEELEVDFAQLDQIMARVLPARTFPLPTAVGFCMLIKRACLNEIGLFDAAAFGKGYGEENDFCMKATASGWSHVLAADTFVRHAGSASFGAQKSEHSQLGAKVLAERYPFYEKLIDQFCREDPLAAVRREIDLARAVPSKWVQSVLFFTHRDGGGVERHVRDLARRWENEGVRALIARPTKKKGSLCEIYCLDSGRLPNLGLDLSGDLAETENFLQALKVGHVHIHHTASYGEELVDWVEAIKQRTRIPFDLTVHDYGPICPRLNFIDGSGVYCGEPDENTCQKCVDNNGTAFGPVDVHQWRQYSQRLLASMRRVLVPSVDVLERYQKRSTGLNLLLKPHIENWPVAPAEFPVRSRDQPLRVALIGSLSPHKGRDVVIACAQDALRRKLLLEFVIVGFSHDSSILGKLSNVVTTGPFDEDHVLDVIARHKCHVALFASVCPETYSYTLTIAMAANLFPFTFDLGAIAERLKSIGWGLVLDRDWIAEPGRINDQLLATERISLTTLPAKTYSSLITDYYELPADFLAHSRSQVLR